LVLIRDGKVVINPFQGLKEKDGQELFPLFGGLVVNRIDDEAAVEVRPQGTQLRSKE
jgi:hypothetical protein